MLLLRVRFLISAVVLEYNLVVLGVSDEKYFLIVLKIEWNVDFFLDEFTLGFGFSLGYVDLIWLEVCIGLHGCDVEP